jgi:hypothetical protein
VLRLLDGLFSIVCGRNFVPLILEQHCQRVCHVFVVINHEDSPAYDLFPASCGRGLGIRK